MLHRVPKWMLLASFVTFLATGGYYACGDYNTPANSKASAVKRVDAGMVDAAGTVKKVRLLAFTAARVELGVNLRWLTGSEVDCASFRILRCSGPACSADQHEAQAGMPAVACQDNLSGAAYHQLDKKATSKTTTYSYILREFETGAASSDPFATAKKAKFNDYGPLVLAAGKDNASWSGKSTGEGAAPSLGSDVGAGCNVSGNGSSASLLFLGLLGALFLVRRRA